MSYRTGDTIKHIPSGETWLVAYCLHDHVIPCGWPLSAGLITDCELVEAATDDEHLALVREMAAMSTNDPRRDFARRELAKREGR